MEAAVFHPYINSEWLFGPSTTQRAQSNGSQRLELLHLDSPQAEHFLQDTVQPSHQLLHDMGISKVVELLSKVLEENKLMKAEITNLGSEVRALRREMMTNAIERQVTVTEPHVRGRIKSWIYPIG
ncbi:unnamed protein product [Arctogadus glacialis]